MPLAACSAAWARRAGAGSPEPHAHAGLAAAAVHAPLARSRADGAATLASCSRRGRREPGEVASRGCRLRRSRRQRKGEGGGPHRLGRGEGRGTRRPEPAMAAVSAALEVRSAPWPPRSSVRAAVAACAPPLPPSLLSLVSLGRGGLGLAARSWRRPAHGARRGGRREGKILGTYSKNFLREKGGRRIVFRENSSTFV